MRTKVLTLVIRENGTLALKRHEFELARGNVDDLDAFIERVGGIVGSLATLMVPRP